MWLISSIGLFLLIIFIGSLFVTYLGNQAIHSDSRNTKFIKWAFEFYFNYLKTGTFSTESTDILLSNQIKLPTSLSGILIGEGFSYKQAKTDIGYLQIIFEVGIAGLVSFIIINLLIIGRIFLRSDTRSEYGEYFLFYLIVFLIGNMKDQYSFFQNGYSLLLFIPFFVAVMSVGQNSHKNRSVHIG